MGGVFMQIRESAEDYLEAILILSQKGNSVRSVDIASMLSVSKPSVSHAMKLLREDGYIAMDRYGTVTLLDKGAEIANRVYERHTILTKMLESLGVPSDIAKTDACKMEHDISEESFERIKERMTADGQLD
jgi:Mn-dependent DtxR family transcriptional regulator